MPPVWLSKRFEKRASLGLLFLAVQFVDILVEEAWHRLGLLKPGGKFSRSKYQACVEAAVDKLKQEKLITERVAALYIQEASVADFPGQ